MRPVRVHGGPTIRAHGRSECEIAHSNRCCVRSCYLSLLPEASWARHVPFPVREALNERFVTLLYHCHLYLAIAAAPENAQLGIVSHTTSDARPGAKMGGRHTIFSTPGPSTSAPARTCRLASMVRSRNVRDNNVGASFWRYSVSILVTTMLLAR